MSDEPTHRVVGKHFYRESSGDSILPDRIEVGDEVVPREGELESFPERFEPLDGEDAAGDADDEEVADSDGGEFAPGDLTVSELEDWADGIDDAEVVASALDAERNGKDRATATSALESRLDDLGG